MYDALTPDPDAQDVVTVRGALTYDGPSRRRDALAALDRLAARLQQLEAGDYMGVIEAETERRQVAEAREAALQEALRLYASERGFTSDEQEQRVRAALANPKALA
jgi:hypothetical protein